MLFLNIGNNFGHKDNIKGNITIGKILLFQTFYALLIKYTQTEKNAMHENFAPNTRV